MQHSPFVLNSDGQLLIYYNLLYKKIQKMVISLVFPTNQFVSSRIDSILEKILFWLKTVFMISQ